MTHHIRTRSSSSPRRTSRLSAALAALGLSISLSACDSTAFDASTSARSTAAPYGAVTLVWAIDGDTVVVTDPSGQKHSVRLIGVNTPEMNLRSTKEPECGAEAATEHLREVLGEPETTLILKDDPKIPDHDKHGRVLAYVQTPAGTDVGAAQLSAGWAEVRSYGQDPERLNTYTDLAETAREQTRGLHRICSS